MPLGRHTRGVVPSNIVLDKGLADAPKERGNLGIGLGIGTRSPNWHCKLRPIYR